MRLPNPPSPSGLGQRGVVQRGTTRSRLGSMCASTDRKVVSEGASYRCARRLNGQPRGSKSFVAELGWTLPSAIQTASRTLAPAPQRQRRATPIAQRCPCRRPGTSSSNSSNDRHSACPYGIKRGHSGGASGARNRARASGRNGYTGIVFGCPAVSAYWPFKRE